ncbi:DUF4062 domain-containing protein [Xanthomonas arboricola]|uniref:DUF4062 domain-containing protein n=1 Tax=Xanthomonas arboricola TaxID=56448 RepID=UPI000CEE3C83|nr:DUF4062 domain-containing protein [Xanthomonas arboricola]PPT54898.1 hypothetical protein XarbCFBP8153_20345 [Xanthomonas arboricola]
MSSKFQIFVSSTFRDLHEERDLVIKAILEMGHIPVGMEMFSAADEEQWNIIKKQIDESDYYIVVCAHCYGTCDANGLSYTEKEYDYAISKGIPALGFILDDNVSWPKERSDSEKNIVVRLEAFKEKVKRKPVSFWKNGEDLYGRCSIALMKAFNAYPREGWVRSSKVQDAAAAKEIVRLSAENADLRQKIKNFEEQEKKQSDVKEVMATLRNSKQKIAFYKKGAADWEFGKKVTLYQVFEVVAPELQVEFSLSEIARYIATHINDVPFKELRNTWPTPRNTLRSLLADLAALGCVEPSKRRKPVSDKEEYWSLSPLGFLILSEMRKRRLNKVENLSKIVETHPPKDKSDA